MLVPVVVEREGHSERSYDIFSRLLKDRIIMLHGPVVEGLAATITSQLLLLENQNKEQPIHMYINSPGGLVTEGLAIYDVMNVINAPVFTYALGQVASMGSFLASAGEKGHRYILPHTRHMIHQPSGGYRGQATDILIHAEEIKRLKKELTEAYVRHTGQKYEKLYEDMERDRFLSAGESVEYGLADEIISKI